jgi:hypothetical protein
MQARKFTLEFRQDLRGETRLKPTDQADGLTNEESGLDAPGFDPYITPTLTEGRKHRVGFVPTLCV